MRPNVPGKTSMPARIAPARVGFPDGRTGRRAQPPRVKLKCASLSETLVPKKRKPPAATGEKTLPRDHPSKEGGPAREREQPEELIRGAVDDDLAERLGEEFVASATSGEQAAEDMRDEEVPEESGGPFVETSGASEFAYGTDASNPK